VDSAADCAENIAETCAQGGVAMGRKDPFLLTPEECDEAAAEALTTCEKLPECWQRTAAQADARHYMRVAEVKRWIQSRDLRPPE
jgi:hypothetical protein